MQFFHFAIFKKNENFLAVLTNQNTEWEKGHYHEQGYIFLMYVSAFTANGAIEIAKHVGWAEHAKPNVYRAANVFYKLTSPLVKPILWLDHGI